MFLSKELLDNLLIACGFYVFFDILIMSNVLLHAIYIIICHSVFWICMFIYVFYKATESYDILWQLQWQQNLQNS